jgi:hypothetical protein
MATMDQNDHKAVWKAQYSIAKGSDKPDPKLEETLREAVAAGRETAQRIQSEPTDDR